MKKKLVSVLCVTAMAVSLLAGCGGKEGGTEKEPEAAGQSEESTKEESREEETAGEASEEEGGGSGLDYVELDWYLPTGSMPDCEEVNAALNEYFLEKINTKVNIHYWEPADFQEKVPTMLRSGQDMGIVSFGMAGVMLVQDASQGAFYPLDELLAEYGAGTKGLFSDDEWKSVMVNGQIYGIPTRKDNCYIIGMVYNADLAEELELDMEALEFKNWRQNEEVWIEALAKRDQLHPEWKGAPLLGNIGVECPYHFALEKLLENELLVCNIDGINDIAGYDSNTVINFFETDEYREYCLMRQRLVASGVCAYDYTEWQNRMYNEEFMLADASWGHVYIDEHIWNENCTTKLRLLENTWTDTSNYSGRGNAISANCANPERAMMVLELVNTDPYVATMLRFGIEGEHYVYDEEGNMTLEGSPRNGNPPDYGYRYWFGPSIGNLFIVNAPKDLMGPDNAVFEGIQKCNKEAKLASHMGFVVDNTNIVNEIAACNNVISEYQGILNSGGLESQEAVEKTLDDFNAKLKANNVDKIVEEVQAQIDAWNAAQ